MKTSILVPTFAALCLLITFAEKPKHNSAENSNVSLVSNFYYSPADLVYAEPASSSSADKNETRYARTEDNNAKDLDYLKFDVADYSGNNDMPVEEIAENSFDYLKFDVSRYTESSELESLDETDMPVNEFANLKFDVNEYSDNTKPASYEEIELPVNQFEYLKFDVNNFTGNDEIKELPVDEYSYLKFDVNNYISETNQGSDNIGELPGNE
jgi:hypothetical protein